MGQQRFDAAKLMQRVKALITKVSNMKSDYPLKPVWGGLPRGDHGTSVLSNPASSALQCRA
jgi:hypothetical protein